jgi:ATP-dependent helicase HepA
MDLLLGSEKGNCAFTIWPDEKVHEILLEAIFLVECVAPPQLHVDRFLPPTPVRVLVNHTLDDRSEDVVDFNRQLKNSDNFALFDNPQVKQELLPDMLNECQEIAASQLRGVVEAAVQQMKNTLRREVQRLIELQKVNPEITDTEIALYRQEIDALYDAMNASRLRLDALRLICRGC